MEKKIFKNLLVDCIHFFIISILSATIIIWVVQAVNFLDIIVEDGRNTGTYLKYTLSSLPKILSKILPFILLITLIFILSKYEQNNELIIFWNFGVSKKVFINIFLNMAVLIVLVQVILVSIIVPFTQDYSRKIIKSSSVNFIDSFIKTKKFNATLEGLTLFNNSKDEDGNIYNIYLKNGTGSNFQIISAKKGKVMQIDNNYILELFDGQTISYANENVSQFKFSKTKLLLNKFKTGTITHRKTQQVSTINLIRCFKKIYKEENIDLSNVINIENCRSENKDNIIKEFYKRLVMPFYIPSIILTALLLILTSKEKGFYQRKKLGIFLLGLLIIIMSEILQKFINENFYSNLIIFALPFISILILYIIFKIKLNFSGLLNENL